MHGKGILTFANGDIYDGYFKNDMKNGKAIYTYADGRQEEQVWKDGQKLE